MQQDYQSQLWDPFFEVVEPRFDKVEKPTKRLNISARTSSFLALFAICLFLMAFASFFFLKDEALLIFASTCQIGVFGIMFALAKLTKKAEFHAWALGRIAAQNQWSFALLKAAVVKSIAQSNHPRRVKANDISPMPSKRVIRDPLIEPLYAHLRTLLKARVGQLMSINPSAVYWGKTRNGVPLWMGVDVGEVNLALAAKPLKTDARGNVSNHGYAVMFVVAYPLERKTGINALLLAEAFTGDSWRDIKTESTEMNEAFHISAEAVEPEADGDVELALRRTLTPATQVAFLDLKKRYRAQFALRDDVVFMSGYDLINIAEIETAAEYMGEAADAFAEAARSFKEYVE